MEVSLLTLIRADYLADLTCIRITTKNNLKNIHLCSGDFSSINLAESVNTKGRNELIVDSYIKHAFGRKAIAFTADIQHADDLATAFRESGIKAKLISGTMSLEERDLILRQFSQGEIQVLCNCSLLTEGYDEPTVDCIIMARPTKSTAFYTQCIGRGTRKFPGKINCLVLDFYNHRHDVCSFSDLFEDQFETLADGESVKKAAGRKDGKRYLPTVVHLEVEEREVDLLGKSKFRWLQVGEQWVLPIQPKENIFLIPIAKGRYQVMLVKENIKKVLYESLSFGYAQGVSEEYARKHGRNFCRRDAA